MTKSENMNLFGATESAIAKDMKADYTMRMLRMSYAGQEHQFLRMVFNAVTKNVDDHTKNISYMMNKDGEWKLSPAYDIILSSDSS